MWTRDYDQCGRQYLNLVHTVVYALNIDFSHSVVSLYALDIIRVFVGHCIIEVGPTLLQVTDQQLA